MFFFCFEDSHFVGRGLVFCVFIPFIIGDYISKLTKMEVYRNLYFL